MSGAIAKDSEGHVFELRPWLCPICGPAKQKTLGQRGGRFQRYGRGVPTSVVQCLSCGLIFPNPFPIPADPQELYGHPDEYFSGPNERSDLTAYRELVAEVRRRTGRSDPSILDIGSGRGELLAAALGVGLRDVVGIELSQAFAAAARLRFGVTVHAMTIEEYAAVAGRKFDCIVINGVLEHVYDPDLMIACAAKLTEPGGVLFLDVPNEPNLLTRVGNLFNRVRGNGGVYNLTPTWPPYHVYAFNPRSINRLLKKHGYRIESLQIYASIGVTAKSDVADRLAAFVATQLNRVANWTGTAEDMKVWARLQTAV